MAVEAVAGLVGARSVAIRGLDGLRVVDWSVVSSEPDAKLNAPTIMLAERAADMIRGSPFLPASNAPVGLAEGWDERQRPGSPIRRCGNPAS
ncbi:GMC oxidoreductase [Amaricoccus sp.]|uniref:GMC oxidoreductase n=1 Tax=Amaricoccus sp. TaxID=1872485 RepID=UPI002D023AF5|nr:GMC oxidoreductase [Amaricoccus sp.]HMQ92396.1 GMC oxidoreductase [Amaricoccus sp.]